MITRGLIGLAALVGLSKETEDSFSSQSFTEITVRSADWKQCKLVEAIAEPSGQRVFEYNCQGSRIFIVKKRISL